MPEPKKNVAFTFVLPLVDSANRPNFKSNPTLAAGDFKHSGDGSALTNLGTLPTVDPASSRLVKIVLSQAEMNYDRVTIQCVDAAGGEWDEVLVTINTTAVTVDDLVRSATPANALAVESDGRVSLGNTAHGGAAATLRLGASTSTPAFYVTNSGGDATKFEATGGDGIGLSLLANGIGAGLFAQGGVNGKGGVFSGGSNSGQGLYIAALGGNTAGLVLVSSGTGKALDATGGVRFDSWSVTGTSTLTGAVSLGSTLGVTGTVTFNAFTVTNALTVSGTTALAGAVTASNASNNIVGIDVAKISGDAAAADNAESFFDGTGYAGTNNVIPRVTLVDTLTTYTGDTPQTGDAYAIVNSGTFGNAALKGYVDDIGVAGAGLTAIPWNAAWDAEVQSECADALTAYGVSTVTTAQVNAEVDTALADYDGPTHAELVSEVDAVQADIAALPTAAQNAAALLAAGDVDGFSLEETLKLCLAALAGKLSGAADTTIIIRAADDSKDRLTATVDADGNRLAITLDGAG